MNGATGITVGYTAPTASNDSHAIQDTTGNDAATISAQAVTKTINIISGENATINGFANGDTLHFFSSTAILNLSTDTDQADGIQEFTAADGAAGVVTTITLTGLTSDQDNAIFNMTDSFKSVFGANAIT